MKRILCFGDSNTYGSSPSGGRYEDRWPVLLAKELGPEYTVIEEGFGGRTIAMDDPVEGGYKSAVEYAVPCLGSHSPLDLVIVMLGTNDSKERFCLSAAAIGQEMEVLVKRIKSCSMTSRGDAPQVLIVSPPAIGSGIMQTMIGGIFGPQSHEVTLALPGVFARVAKLMQCRFFDANSVCRVSDADQVHMEAEGHAKLARALAAESRKILQNDRGKDVRIV